MNTNTNINIINTTPHAVNLVNSQGELIQTYERKISVRLAMTTVSAGFLQQIPLTRTEFGDAQGLPEYKEGTYYIVSKLVQDALPARPDLLVPAQVLRDQKGQIIGCQSLGVR